MSTQTETDETKVVLIGKAPLSMVRTVEGSYVNVYASQLVPVNASPEDTERLLAEGFLGTAEIIAEPVEVDPRTQAQLDQYAGVIEQLQADREEQARKVEELTTQVAKLNAASETASTPANGSSSAAGADGAPKEPATKPASTSTRKG